MPSFLNTLFGGSVDFPTTESAPTEVDKEEHIKLLTEICEEPQKMLNYYHRASDELAAEDAEFESRRSRADEFRTEGNTHFLAGRHTDSLACYKEAMKLTPNDAKLYSNACLCNMALGHFEEAVVDAFASFYCDKFWSKGYAMMITSYCHIGYMDIANLYVKHALHNFGSEYYNEAQKKISSITKSAAFSSPRKLNKADLLATVQRLFEANHPPRTYAFLLTHIIQHCEWNEDFPAEEVLKSVDFSRRALQVPYFKRLLSPDVDISALQIDDVLNLIYILRLLGPILMMDDETPIPNIILSFVASLGPYWTKESTAKLIKCQKIPFGHILFDYFCRLLTTIAASKATRSRFFKSTPIMNRTDWLVRLPVACFSILNPARYPETYFSIIRLICMVSAQNWFVELPRKSPPSDLAKAIGLYSSFGIVCDRLMDYELPFEDGFSELDITEAFYIFFKQMSDCDDSVIRLFAQIPEVWMMFARRLAKNPHDPGENAYCLLAMEGFLKPWVYETDSELKTPLPHTFEDGPWFDMLLYSLPKLMLPKKRFRDTIISAVGVTACFASASRKFAERLLAEVPILKFNKFHDRGIDDDGAIHLFAVMLSVIDDASVCDLVLNEHDEFDTAVCTLFLALTQAEEQFYDTICDREIYHACVAAERLLKIASRLEASKNQKEMEAGKELREMIVNEFGRCYQHHHELSQFFNSLVSWVKGTTNPRSSKTKPRGGRKQTKKGVAGKKKPPQPEENELPPDSREKIPTELSSPVVHKLFDALTAADSQMAKILQQVKAKRRQF